MTIDMKEIIHRHDTLQKYIINRTWDSHPRGKPIEFELIREVVNGLAIRKPELNEFIYIYDYEWEVTPGESDKGKGDLIFTNGKDSFLIIECKTKDSNFVRNQVRERIEQFRKKISKFKDYHIYGLAVSPQSWDYLNENGEWEFEVVEEDEIYIQSYAKLNSEQEKTNLRSNYQSFYQNLGYKPKDPISALNELIQAEFLVGKLPKHPKENNPPFLVKLRFTLLKVFPGRIVTGSGENFNYTIAKGLAASNICEQIYLSYTMKKWAIPIEQIDRSNVYRTK